MKTLKTKFKDMVICQTENFYDRRGYFRELSIEKKIKKKLIFTVMSNSKKMYYVVCTCKKKISKVSMYLLSKGKF